MRARSLESRLHQVMRRATCCCTWCAVLGAYMSNGHAESYDLARGHATSPSRHEIKCDRVNRSSAVSQRHSQENAETANSRPREMCRICHRSHGGWYHPTARTNSWRQDLDMRQLVHASSIKRHREVSRLRDTKGLFSLRRNTTRKTRTATRISLHVADRPRKTKTCDAHVHRSPRGLAPLNGWCACASPRFGATGGDGGDGDVGLCRSSISSMPWSAGPHVWR
jgi:hypothetical protein